MIQGRYFKVDEHSNYQKGQIIFRYLPVMLNEKNGKMDKPLYPVYLVLNPYAVNFYYHGLPFDENREKDKNDKTHLEVVKEQNSKTSEKKKKVKYSFATFN